MEKLQKEINKPVILTNGLRLCPKHVAEVSDIYHAKRLTEKAKHPRRNASGRHHIRSRNVVCSSVSTLTCSFKVIKNSQKPTSALEWAHKLLSGNPRSCPLWLCLLVAVLSCPCRAMCILVNIPPLSFLLCPRFFKSFTV